MQYRKKLCGQKSVNIQTIFPLNSCSLFPFLHYKVTFIEICGTSLNGTQYGAHTPNFVESLQFLFSFILMFMGVTHL